MKFYFAVFVFGIFQYLSKAAINNDLMTPFHPITQEQYDAILGLTSGEPVISEGRLIASGIAALTGIATGLKLGFSASWLPSFFSNWIGSQRNDTKDILNAQDGYPLCVVKTPVDNNNGKTTDENDNHTNGTIIKCIMVIKQDENNEEKEEEEPYKPYYPPYPPPPQPYVYNYPWFNNYYRYPTQQYQPHSYEPPQYDYQETVPNTRYYPNHYDSTNSKRTNPSSSYQKHNNNHKTRYTKKRKTHPTPANYYDYRATSIPKRRKTKRDQYSTNAQQLPNNYAKISNFPNQGYQPAIYPQISYHSQYPKVAYSPSYNYPSPVYVGTTPRPVQFSSTEDSEVRH